jgi:hypothetical protein
VPLYAKEISREGVNAPGLLYESLGNNPGRLFKQAVYACHLYYEEKLKRVTLI